MLAHPTRANGIALVESWGLDAPALLEPHSEGALPRVAALSADAGMAESLAAWRRDRAARGGQCGRGDWVQALVLSNRESADMVGTVDTVDWIRDRWQDAGKAARKRCGARAHFRAALQIVRAEDGALAECVATAVVALAAEPGGLSPAPWVTGDDLVRHGLVPGPAFRTLLERAYDRQLDGTVLSREDALKAILGEFRPPQG